MKNKKTASKNSLQKKFEQFHKKKKETSKAKSIPKMPSKTAVKKEAKIEKKQEKSTDSKKPEDTKKKKFGFFGMFKRKKVQQDQKSPEFLQKKLKKIKKKNKKPLAQERKYKLKFYLDRAGMLTPPNVLVKRIFQFCIGFCLLLSAYTIYSFANATGYTVSSIATAFALIWTVVFAGLLTIIWIMLYLVLDVRIYKRRIEIEEVLPDYLQLTASNIKAGMTIDRALWYAVRPRFGVLANEIEVVAKETMRGEDLKKALNKFSDKYDSPILKRAMSLLIEGIESGGQIGTLLNKISINIQENRIMKREMAANVTTYVIFISFATVAAAPALFALSGVLIQVITSLGSSFDSTAATGFSISFSGGGINYNDFRIFAIVELIITSLFSSIIIATIIKGNAKAGLKYIPMFIIASIAIFLAADFFLSNFVGFIG